ncbi:MAG: ABC transporter substrate-binding protein [Clostridia bacterium]|nr:ABC transporter substrate-binding protein [Clostridia bacterium]
MKRISLLLFVLIVCAGCAKPQPVLPSEKDFYTFTDSTGYTVTLPAKPQKTAVLFSSFAEIWALSGGEIALTVGESVERGFADPTVALADTGAGKTVNKEILLAAECDFVIGSADIPAQVQAVELLRKNGVPCALLRVETFADYLEILRIFCDINENESAYNTYGTAVQTEIDNIFASMPTDSPAPRILFIRSGSSVSSAKAKTADTHFAAAMLKELGTYNIAEAAWVLTENLSTEEILIQNPDFIFIATMGEEDAAKAYMNSVLQSDTWQALTAVQNGRVIYLPKDLFQYKPNHRWAEAYEYLANQLN